MKSKKDYGIDGWTNFSWYVFMSRDFGLGGVELLVYMAIYSFSKDGVGYFFGSQDYLSEITGNSTRAIRSALKSLVEKGLIIKEKNDELSVVPYKYRADLERVKEVVEKASDPTPVGLGNCDRPNGKVLPPTVEKTSSNNIIDNKTITTSTTTIKGAHAHARGRGEQKGVTCHSVKRYGYEGLVFMTEEQYGILEAMVGSEILSEYIMRLEATVLNPKVSFAGEHVPAPHSYYKTLKKWIEADMST